jgi:N-acetylmuramoyl-L-alanine amidase
MVDEDGSILQLVDEEKKAWHAGISCWQGRTLLNDTSIGIEIVNPGHEFGYRKFPKEQMVAVKDLCLDIIERHEIPARNVVGHSDIAPSRKQDPGELFEWEWLSRCGVGLWPKRQVVFQPTKALLQLEDVTAGVQRLQQRLSQYGYHLRDDGYFGPKVEYTVEAFKRHFVPDQLNGIWDKKSEAVLSSLLKQVS